MKRILLVITFLSLFAFGGFYILQNYEADIETVKEYVCNPKTGEQILAEKLRDYVQDVQLLETIVCYQYSSGYLHCYLKDQGTGRCYKQIINEGFSMQSFSPIDCEEIIERLERESEDGTDEKLERRSNKKSERDLGI